MKVTQITEILNEILPETLGSEDIKLENLDGIVDIGKKLPDVFDQTNAVDNFMKKLVDRIGKVVFVDRPYSGRAPSVMMDGWQYGSILQKIRTELPDSEKNPTWDLVNGQDYPVTKFNAPSAEQKFFNSKDTYQIAMSFARKQVEESFTSAQGVNALFSLIQSRIEMRKTIDRDELIMRVINTFIGATLQDNNKARAINLLTEYNTATNESLTVANCMYNLDFLKYASFRMKLASKHMENASKLFNIGGTTKFTPKSLQKVILLDQFAERANIYLQSDTFHNEFTKFPDADTVSFWQGSGTDYSFDSVSKINVTIQKPDGTGTTETVEQGGILGCIFDRDALGVCNVKDYVTSFYNPSAEFENMWYKYDAMYFNDYDENGIVFYVAEAAA